MTTSCYVYNHDLLIPWKTILNQTLPSILSNSFSIIKTSIRSISCNSEIKCSVDQWRIN